MVQQVRYELIAEMDTSRPMGGNAIHSDDGAKDYGYQSALVVGGYVYSWAVPAILDVLGKDWSQHGWAEIQFRRPVYVGDQLAVSALSSDDSIAKVLVRNQREEDCLVAQTGIGDAPWLRELILPKDVSPKERLEERPPLTLQDAPIGLDLRPSSSFVSAEASEPYFGVVPAADNSLWAGPEALVHPAWVIGRMTGLQLHSYRFSPSIAAAIRIQHVNRFRAGQQITVAGHFRNAYERKGHHYSVIDGLILGEGGAPQLQVQQTTIFNVAKRE